MLSISRFSIGRHNLHLGALSLIGVTSLLLSCAAGPISEARRAIDSEDWGVAAALLEQKLEESPDEGMLYRDLGLAQLELGLYSESVGSLQRARDLLPEDNAVPLLLGLAHEGLEEWNEGIAAYRSYPRAAGRTFVARAMRGRISRLVRHIYGERARSSLDNPEELVPNVLAVRYFDVLAEVETFGNLGKGLAEQLISDLSRIETLHLVERLRYEELQNEIEASRRQGYDPLSAVSLDALLGAAWSLGGTITPLEGKGEIRFDYYLVNNQTGNVGSPQSLSGRLSEFFELEKRMVYGVAEQLNLPLDRKEREAISEIPTTNFKAYLAYCDGMDAEDREDYDRSAALFDEAIRLDPLFFLAEERGERMAGTKEMVAAIARAEMEAPALAARRGRLDRASALLLPATSVPSGERDDISVVRPLGIGSATVTVRVDQP